MPIVKKHISKIESIANPLTGIYTVTLSSDKKFVYNPGQFLHLALDDYDGIGQWPESRCFSMQSNPQDKFIKITFAAKGSFTNRMANELKIGKKIWLKLPYGDIFDRSHSKKNCVFIAGGTGITPFLSLFSSESFKEYINPKIYLGFRSKEFNLYKNELSFVLNSNINISYENLEGVININSILEENSKDSIYFISGPPAMIKSFKEFLVNKTIPEKNIITDDWE